MESQEFITSNTLENNENIKINYDKNDPFSLKSALLNIVGINLKYIDFMEIYVNNEETIHICVIDEFENGNEVKPDLVFVHGLTGTSIFFYKCFKSLSKYARIIALDLPGMGFSNRVKINTDKFSFEEAQNFFLDRINIALEKINVEKFHFISHSFGGYMSSLYSIKFPQKVLSLTLLSPIGITSSYIEYFSTPTEEFMQKMMYMLNLTPTEGFKSIPFFYKIMDNLLNHKLRHLGNKEEQNIFKEIIHYIYSKESTSEYFIFKFFNVSIQPFKPIIYFYEVLKDIKIDFIYGDNDWNPIDHSEDV